MDKIKPNSGKLFVKSMNKMLYQHGSQMPSISVVIPVFHSKSTLKRALYSIKKQVWPQKHVEIILSIDDGKNYDWAEKYWSNITICSGYAPATGAGPTRNRGILASTGRYLAFLDSDDEWADGYLDALYPVAETHGLAFGQTVVHSHDGTYLMSLGHIPDDRGGQLRFDDFGRWPGSFHPMMQREMTPFFLNQPAQDVFHAIETMAMFGGMFPLVGAANYRLNLNAGSVTASAGFSHRLDWSYRHMAQWVMSGRSYVPKGKPA